MVKRRRSVRRRKCPRRGHSAYGDKAFTRRLHDLVDLAVNRASLIDRKHSYDR